MRTFLLLSLLALAAHAQTVGVPGVNDLTINGAGSGAASCHALAIATGPRVLQFLLDGLPSSTIIAAIGTCQLGSLPVLGGTSLDLGLGSLAVIFDGSGIFLPPPPPFLAPSASTNSAGVWAHAVAANIPPGALATLQVAQLNAALPAGINFSQAHSLIGLGLGAATLCPGTVGHDLSPLSDDGSVGIALPTPFRFYGTNYSNVFVNMNGNLTFGSGSADFSPSETDMLGQQPRIAVAWDDWNPADAAQGTVRAFDNGTTLSVEWFDVRHFGTAACGTTPAGFQDSNTFCVELEFATGNITLRHGVMILCSIGLSPSTDQLVGISPGSGLSAPNNVNLNGGTHVGASANQAIYEDFGAAAFGPFDLGPTWGATAGVRFLSNGSGAGPYTSQSF